MEAEDNGPKSSNQVGKVSGVIVIQVEVILPLTGL